MNLGNAIQSVRKHKGIKQGDMVERTKLTQGYLSQIENNKKDPNLSSLKKISDALEVPLPVIFFLALDNEDIPEKSATCITCCQHL
jgi:transcriptional regulator with XRE-family HTH domain